MSDTKLGDGKPKPAGTWDYYGQYDPAYPGRNRCMGETFSVGIFQWVLRYTPDGIFRGKTKRGKAINHIRGFCSDADQVYNRARAEIHDRENATK